MKRLVFAVLFACSIIVAEDAEAVKPPAPPADFTQELPPPVAPVATVAAVPARETAAPTPAKPADDGKAQRIEAKHNAYQQEFAGLRKMEAKLKQLKRTQDEIWAEYQKLDQQLQAARGRYNINKSAISPVDKREAEDASREANRLSPQVIALRQRGYETDHAVNALKEEISAQQRRVWNAEDQWDREAGRPQKDRRATPR